MKTIKLTYENGGTNKTTFVEANTLEEAVKVLGFNPKQFILSRSVTWSEV